MAFLGMRGNDDWVAEQRPKNYRQGMILIGINGNLPLTALMDNASKEPTDDPEFKWWTKNLAQQNGTILGVYTDAAMLNAYAANAVAGQTLYIRVTQALASEFRPGHQVLLRDASDLDVDVNAKVTAVILNGNNSMISCLLLEDDDNSNNHDLSDADSIIIIGNINPEGGQMPQAVAYDPVKYYNYTQIWRTPLSITRTARKTKLRTGDQYQEAKREALEIHGIEMEKSLLWSIMTERTGDNGKPERTTMGIIPFIKTYAPANVDNFTLNADFAGLTWLQGGEDWLDTQLERIFRYGSTEKMAVVGNTVLLGIQRLCKNSGQMNLTPSQTLGWGIKVRSWETTFGTIMLKSHPLFNHIASMRDQMVILEPKLMRARIIDDTDFYDMPEKEKSDRGHGRIDGVEEEFLTELGYEYHNPQAWGILSGFNADNGLTP